MKHHISHTLKLLLSILAILLIQTSVAFSTEHPEQVESEANITERLNEQVDLNRTFVDEAGTTVSLKQLVLENRPAIIVPVYFDCPRLCGFTLKGVTALLNTLTLKLGEDFTVLTVSFNYRETAQLAGERAKKYRAMLTSAEVNATSWHFLTGTKENIAGLMNELGFSFKEDNDQFVHAAAFMILTPLGKISRYFYGISYDPANVRLALVEASRGKIGSTFERVFLYCFHFDAFRGKYTPIAMNVMRVACFLVLAVLVVTVVALKLGETVRK